MKHEKRENKHSGGQEIDVIGEQRRFSHLIEVLSERLNEKPDLSSMPRQIISNGNEKKGDKVGNTIDQASLKKPVAP